MKRHSPLIDSLYVFGILLVVAGHGGPDVAFGETPLFRWIYAFHMPLFFALSGYLFCLTDAAARPFGELVRQKALRLLLPLAVLTLCAFIPKALLSAYAMRPMELSADALLRAFLYPADNPIRPLWFLTVLFEVYLCGYGLLRLVGKRTAATLGAALLLLAAFYLLPKIWLLQLSDMLYYTAFFLLGYLFCRYEKVLIGRLHLGNPAVTLLLGALTLLPLYYYQSLLRPLYALFGLFFAVSLAGGLLWHGIRIFPALRPYTFTIYLFHVVPQAAIRGFVWPHAQDYFWTVYAAMIVAGVAFPWLIGYAGDRVLSPAKPAARIVRRIIGI